MAKLSAGYVVRVRLIGRSWPVQLSYLTMFSWLLVACSTPSATPVNSLTPAATPTPTTAPTATAAPSRKLTVMPLPDDPQMLIGIYDLFAALDPQKVVSRLYLPIVANSAADVGWFKQLPQPLATIDWPNEVAILIYMQGGSRNLYAITMREMTQTGDKVRVDCEVKRPSPGTIEPAILNYFVAAAVVRRGNFQPKGALTFSFYDQSGTLIAETKTTIQ